MMIPKQSTSGNENWFSSIPPWARATGVLTICIGTATGLIYLLDQSSKNSTPSLGTNPNPNPTPTPNSPSKNTDLSSPLEINTPNPNSNFPTPSNTKPPLSTFNLPNQSLTPFTTNNSKLPNQSNPNSNINPINTNGQNKQSLSIPIDPGTNQTRNINPQNQKTISTTNIPELDNIAATKTQQNTQVIPSLMPSQNNRQIGKTNINPTGTRNQITSPVSGNPNRQQISIQTPPPQKNIPIFSNQSSAGALINQINNQGNRNIQTKPAQNTKIFKEKPQKIAQQNINLGKIEPQTNLTNLNKTGANLLNINNPNNSIKNNTSSNTQTNTKNIEVTEKTEQTTPNNPQKTQNIPKGKGKIAANNSQTNPKRENKVTQKTTSQNPATPPTSNTKINPSVGLPVLQTLPPPPPINPPSNDNFNNTQSTPLSLSNSDPAAQKPPSPPSPNKISTSERVKNDSYPSKNSPEILIENPDKIAINTPLETTLPNRIIPQVKEVQDYLQTRWKVPPGLNQTIQYILVLDSDGTITDIQPIEETAKKYREATNIPAPGDKFVSPLSLGKLPKIRVVFDQDGKVQTFLEDE